MAYADDVVLLAESEMRLQNSIDQFEEGLRIRGLEINRAKCATIDRDTVPRDRQLVVKCQNAYKSSKGELPVMNAVQFYKYLGIDLGASGTRITSIKRLEEKIRAIKKAPLKPQQRLWILKTHLIPGLFHQLVLGSVSKEMLSGMDRVIRRIVRNILHWPSDTPVEMFHVKEDAGGLGIPLLQVCIPILKEQRLVRMLNSSDELIGSNFATSFFLQQLRKVEALRGKVGGITPRDKRETQDALKKALHEKVDGKGLASVQISGGHSILTNSTLLMKGRNFIGVMKIRGNLVSTKSRIARWHWGQDTSCESCGRRETLGHVLQVCPRSRGERIRRHDCISAFVVNKAKNKGFQIWQEPEIKTQMGMRKPDLILAKKVSL